MKFNIPITISIACQSITVALIIITFILENWITVKSTNIRYGIWKGCNLTECYNWYSDGQKNLNFKLTNSFQAFQGLQSCMLGLVVLTLVSLFLNLKICAKKTVIFITDAILIFLATCCGLVSLIVFATDVYNAEKYNLDVCFWLSVVALILIFLALIMLIAYIISIEVKSTQRSKNDWTNIEQTTVYYNNSYKENLNSAPITEKAVNLEIKSDDKSNNVINGQQDKLLDQNPIGNTKDGELENKISPRFQKNTPSQTESRLKNRINAKNNDEVKTVNSEMSKKPNRNYWNNKKKAKKHRYHHEHYDEKRPSQEQYRPGYSSEPDMIEYSLDRSWASASNNLNSSMPILDNETNGLTGTFNSRHFVKLPKLIYYDGSNHYTRENKNN